MEELGNTMFEELLKNLRNLETDRQMIEVEFGDIFITEWVLLHPRTENAIVRLGNEYRMTRKAYFQLVKLMNSALGTNTIDAKYLWNYSDVMLWKMPDHVTDYMVLRATSSKRDHNRIKLMVHGDLITAVMSTNYVDYSNLELVEAFAEACVRNNMEPKTYTYKLKNNGDELEFIPVFEQEHEGNNLYGAGVMLVNSQNKSAGLMIAPVVKSTACDNSILSWWAQGHRHDKGIAEFATSHVELVPDLVGLAVETYHNYIAALDIIIDPDDMDNILEYIRKRFNLSKRHILKLREGFTSEFDIADGTLFGLVSGLTYLVNHLDESRAPEGNRILRYAGRLLQLEFESGVATFRDISEA